MSQVKSRYQFMLCAFGFHQLPPPRDPPGPIVAMCPCCHKLMYCYGLDIYTRGIYTTLLLPNFPRPLNAHPALPA